MRFFSGAWFLNPWAEVRRLQREAYEQHKWAIRERNSCRAMEDLADQAITALENQEAENADLRRRIAEMDSRESGAENRRFCAEKANSNHAYFVASIDMGNRK